MQSCCCRFLFSFIFIFKFLVFFLDLSPMRFCRHAHSYTCGEKLLVGKLFLTHIINPEVRDYLSMRHDLHCVFTIVWSHVPRRSPTGIACAVSQLAKPRGLVRMRRRLLRNDQQKEQPKRNGFSQLSTPPKT